MTKNQFEEIKAHKGKLRCEDTTLLWDQLTFDHVK